jgi:hydrogenase maturation protease
VTKAHRNPSETQAPVIVIGTGNPYRRDDGVGRLIARRLSKMNPGNFLVLETEGEATELTEAWKNAELAIVIDAVSSAGEAGKIHRFDALSAPLRTSMFTCSTHSLGIVEALDLSRALKRLPARLFLYGIEGRCFDVGTGLSAEVEAAMDHVIQSVLEDIAGFEVHRPGDANASTHETRL